MKRLSHILVVFLPFFVLGQNLGNFGNLRLHDTAQMGLHGNLVNRGSFRGFDTSILGFYGAVDTFVEGNANIDVYDVEFGNQIATHLNIPLNVANNANFVSGNVTTPLGFNSIAVNFSENAFYVGSVDDAKIVGYASKTNTQEFTFPVGDFQELRPLVIRSNSPNGFARCTYVRENIGNSVSTGLSYDTETKSRDVGLISTREYWVLQGNVSSTITLNWNSRSAMDEIVQDVAEIVIVGWSLTSNQWVPLSEPVGVGDLTQGIISSNEFLPDDYGAITFGTTPMPLDTFAVNNPTLGDYFLSPNADGVNDGLVFDNLEDTGANMVRIYNKFGQKVFEQQNYTNEFRGFANTGMLIFKQEIGLPEGVYYYTIDLMGLDLAYQGFLFLNR